LKLLNKASQFYNSYITRYEICLLLLLLSNLLIGLTILTVNHYYLNYHGLTLYNYVILLAIPVFLAMLCFSCFARKYAPHTALIMNTYSIMFIGLAIGGISTTAIQDTPFHPIDQYIASIDHFFHYSVVNLYSWTLKQHSLKQFFSYAYDSLAPQFLFLPLIVGLLREGKSIRIYLLTLILGYDCIQLIYYFFPTVAPAGFYHSAIFTAQQKSCLYKLTRLQRHLVIRSQAMCLVSFPSPHVFWALTFANLARKRLITAIPFILLNVLMILSTLFLGWHYLTDVLGAILLFILTTAIAHKMDNWIMRGSNSLLLRN
jgi:membrane-associated phospholipid phosphatase